MRSSLGTSSQFEQILSCRNALPTTQFTKQNNFMFFFSQDFITIFPLAINNLCVCKCLCNCIRPLDVFACKGSVVLNAVGF